MSAGLRVVPVADELDGLRAQTVAPLLVTPEEAAELLRIGRTEVFGLIGRGELESVSLGKRRRVPMAALHAFVARLREQQCTPGGPAAPAPTPAPLREV